jgi:hypothetical protein
MIEVQQTVFVNGTIAICHLFSIPSFLPTFIVASHRGLFLQVSKILVFIVANALRTCRSIRTNAGVATCSAKARR